MRMRAAIVIAALVVVAGATVVALRYGAGRLDALVAQTVESYGSAATGTDVDVGAVDVALSAGRVDIGRITIDNPRGYETPAAVRIGRVRVTLDVASLASAVPVVRELAVEDALIEAEQRGDATNLTDIQRHATAGPAEPDGAERGRIVIERFALRNARVRITSELLSRPEELPLEDVVVDGIGRGTGGAEYGAATEAMLSAVLAAARDAAGDRLRTAAADAAREAARDKLQEETDDAREAIGEKLDELLERK